MEEIYVIKNSMEEFWSKEDGWVDIDSATHFTKDETQTLNLPIGGNWVALDGEVHHN